MAGPRARSSHTEVTMSASPEFCRRALLASAGLLVLVAFVVVLGVIPTVRTDRFSGANVEGSAIAFWVTAGEHVFAAVPVFEVARRSRRPTFALVVIVPLLLLLALALFDASEAFAGHGSEMQATPLVLFPCAAADLVAAGLVVTAWLRFPKAT